MIIAAVRILYRGRTYERGDVLPEDDSAMVQAWEEAGSLMGSEDLAEAIAQKKKLKAKAAAAKAGRGGSVSAGPSDRFGDDLVGVVPRR